jgi:hypothetical protein
LIRTPSFTPEKAGFTVNGLEKYCVNKGSCPMSEVVAKPILKDIQSQRQKKCDRINPFICIINEK